MQHLVLFELRISPSPDNIAPHKLLQISFTLRYLLIFWPNADINKLIPSTKICVKCDFLTRLLNLCKTTVFAGKQMGGADMEFVKNFTPSNFRAKNFTPSISPNFNSFSKKKHKKKWVEMEKFTPLAKILHYRRHWRHWQIPTLQLVWNTTL